MIRKNKKVIRKNKKVIRKNKKVIRKKVIEMKFKDKYNWFIKKSGVQYKEYQYQGVKWCYEKENDDLFLIKGGFIADEMGLGKTIMMIGLFIMSLKKRTLIVLPNILIEQWYNEILRFTRNKALLYHGKNKKKITMDDINNSRIVITSYYNISLNCFHRDKDNSLLHKIHWDRIVFDEAHHLRNKNNLYYGCLLLKSDIRWLISGTPVQNTMKDFMNLCDCLNIPASLYKNKDNYGSLVKNYVLRRTKKSVGIVLPELKFNNKQIEWNNSKEKELSKNIHDAINLLDGGDIPKLYLYLKARQVCIFPGMLKSSSIVKSSISNYSSKLDIVASVILANKNNGNGKLVFCHFHQEIDELTTRLKDGGINKICSFDGRTTQCYRNRLINEDNEVIILQIQTGCEGLNLQKKFSEIYFVSPNWNPFIEEQAIARCHRIGQEKMVNVYRFNMCDINEELISMDNYILNIQNEKREIVKQVI